MPAPGVPVAPVRVRWVVGAVPLVRVVVPAPWVSEVAVRSTLTLRVPLVMTVTPGAVSGAVMCAVAGASMANTGLVTVAQPVW